MTTTPELKKEIKVICNSLHSSLSPNTIEIHCNRILEFLLQMEKLQAGCTYNAISALGHTMESEILYAKNYLKKTKLKNATKKSHDDYKKSMELLLNQIQADLSLILSEE